MAPATAFTRSAIHRAGFGLGHWTLDLSVSDLRKVFFSPAGERIEVLQGISFPRQQVKRSLSSGASGAGKSTLLHLLGGLEAPDHGNITFGTFAIDRASARGTCELPTSANRVSFFSFTTSSPT